MPLSEPSPSTTWAPSLRYFVREQLDSPAGLDGERPVAVELQFVEPVGSLGKPLGAQKQHGLGEFGFDLREAHGSLQDTEGLGRKGQYFETWRFLLRCFQRNNS